MKLETVFKLDITCIEFGNSSFCCGRIEYDHLPTIEEMEQEMLKGTDKILKERGYALIDPIYECRVEKVLKFTN